MARGRSVQREGLQFLECPVAKTFQPTHWPDIHHSKQAVFSWNHNPGSRKIAPALVGSWLRNSAAAVKKLCLTSHFRKLWRKNCRNSVNWNKFWEAFKTRELAAGIFCWKRVMNHFKQYEMLINLIHPFINQSHPVAKASDH